MPTHDDLRRRDGAMVVVSFVMPMPTKPSRSSRVWKVLQAQIGRSVDVVSLPLYQPRKRGDGMSWVKMEVGVCGQGGLIAAVWFCPRIAWARFISDDEERNQVEPAHSTHCYHSYSSTINFLLQRFATIPTSLRLA